MDRQWRLSPHLEPSIWENKDRRRTPPSNPSNGGAWCHFKNAVKIVGQSTIIPARGAIAQLGERVVRNDEAVGSSPTSSTKYFPINMAVYDGCTIKCTQIVPNWVQ
jgi:hypothetical protein